jgi:hypothetical protein
MEMSDKLRLFGSPGCKAVKFQYRALVKNAKLFSIRSAMFFPVLVLQV